MSARGRRIPGLAVAAPVRAALRYGCVALLGFVAVAACVDKSPPPLWPAPPPPSVAEVIGAPAQHRAPPMPVGVVGAPMLAGPPSPLDAVPVDRANILDPEGEAATAAARAHPETSPRPVPTHR